MSVKPCWMCKYYKCHEDMNLCVNPHNVNFYFKGREESVDYISGRIRPVPCVSFNNTLSCGNYKRSKWGKLAYLVNSVGAYPFVVILIVELILIAFSFILGFEVRGQLKW